MIGVLIAAATAMTVTIVATRLLVRFLRARGVGQPIHDAVPSGHTVKAGTPTMGGIALLFGAATGYLVAHARAGVYFTRSGLLVIGAAMAAGLVGFIDDWIKVALERNLGLSKSAKFGGLVFVATAFAVVSMYHLPVRFTLGLSRFDAPGIDIGRVGWVIFVALLVTATANAVNLTDGLDGLAAGSASLSFGAYTVIAFWLFTHPAYGIAHALDITVAAAAMLGACVGFLWWNAGPAQVFMGDTGSLAIGAALAALAVVTATPLLLPIIGGLFVFEALSVATQVAT